MSNSALTFNVADSIGTKLAFQVGSRLTKMGSTPLLIANDHQWIHVDAERAKKESPFGTTIAHGYLTLSLLADMSYEIGIVPEDVAAVFNYGLDKVRFLTPVKSGSRVRARATLTDVTEQAGGRKLLKVTNSIEIEGEPKPALIAETLAVLVGQP
jgi:acyl dehydratase